MATMEGLSALVDRLERLPAAVKDALEAPLNREVEDLVSALKRAAPVSDLEDHPGQLRDSIQDYPNPSRPLSFRIIVGARDSKGRLFGRYVEFGHTSKSGRYVPAAPFFFPTYRARKKAMQRRILAPARQAIRRMFPKA